MGFSIAYQSLSKWWVVQSIILSFKNIMYLRYFRSFVFQISIVVTN